MNGMIARLIAFMRYADEGLVFTKGLSDTEEPDLWIKDLTGQTDLWVEVGAPTVKRIVSKSRASQKNRCLRIWSQCRVVVEKEQGRSGESPQS